LLPSRRDSSSGPGRNQDREDEINISARHPAVPLVKFKDNCPMRQIPKTELSPDNGCIIDTKWKVDPLSYHACATETGEPHTLRDARLPEIVIYDHVGFKGAFARTNLSFNYLGDFWNDRISSLIVVSGVWRFYRDEYYKGDHWDLGPGFYECFFKDKGPDDVISSFKAIKLT
jgi:hypothetical protein